MANAMNDGHLEMCIQSENGCNFVVICDFFLWHPEMIMWQPKKNNCELLTFCCKMENQWIRNKGESRLLMKISQLPESKKLVPIKLIDY